MFSGHIVERSIVTKCFIIYIYNCDSGLATCDACRTICGLYMDDTDDVRRLVLDVSTGTGGDGELNLTLFEALVKRE